MGERARPLSLAAGIRENPMFEHIMPGLVLWHAGKGVTNLVGVPILSARYPEQQASCGCFVRPANQHGQLGLLIVGPNSMPH